MPRRTLLGALLVSLLVLSVDGASIALGSGHSCALLTNSAVMCWGWNYYGQLGDGTTTRGTTPVDVSGITTATSIARGGRYSCALLTGGTIKCWGSNGNGRLGDGTTTDRTTPVEVSGITTSSSGGSPSLMVVLLTTFVCALVL